MGSPFYLSSSQSYPVNWREQGPIPKLFTLAFICRAHGGGLLSCLWKPRKI